MLIETSKDLLFVVLGFCILWLTVFISWLLYYAIAILRDIENFVGRARRLTEKVDDLASTVKEKFEHSAASFTILAQALKELVMWVLEQRAKKKASPRKR
jgi:hypothetical protein